ncbi:uncharacterized protein LOC135438379 [Drosophila montana]|uniref:uncharacterized protein LOC135438379 n=1 Tax=Drosophila montana TaxID=40370 RepID=UPI00313D6E24
MDSLHIMDMPDECLLMVFQQLDVMSQCSFAFTCQRFMSIYEMVHRQHFRCFTWFEPTNNWTAQQIEAFFRLNGHKMRMLSVSDLHDKYFEKPLLSKANHMINVCVYLKNLRSLILCIDHKLPDIIIEVCKHLHKLENLVIDCASHPNYEFLVLLRRLKSLDIEYFVNPRDKLFQRFAELRPDALEHLRIGSEITMKQGKHIAHLRGLTLLNIYNPCYHFVNGVVLQLANLRVLSITSAQQLRDHDFRHLIMHLKFLATLYVIQCTDLGNDFIFFIIQHLKVDEMLSSNCRRLPFHLELSGTCVTEDINEIEPVNSSHSILNVVLVGN